MKITIQIPPKVQSIIEVLKKSGFEAYAVGGCVRDSVLGRQPNDWDITTSASPFQVKKIFHRTVDTGIEHGTVTVIADGEGFEVTTYRIEGEYEDCRHPKEVKFTSDLIEDLKRRDFTINAMAYNEESGLVDVFHGLEDLRQGVVRCVGNAEERFGEDALRILRAVRFAAQLGFEVEKETEAAAKKLAPNLSYISAERIQAELIKLLTSKYPEKMRDAYFMNITKYILPEFDAIMLQAQNNIHHKASVGEHTLEMLMNISEDKVLRIAALLHDIAKPITVSEDNDGIHHFYGHAQKGKEISVKIMRRLKFDNDTLRKVAGLVLWHDYQPVLSKAGVRRAIHKVGEELFPDFILLKRSDILAQSDYQKEEKLSRLDELECLYKEIMKEQECVSLKGLAVSGKDLIEAGIRPGKEIGRILDLLLEDVLEENTHNNKIYLLERAASIKNS